MFLGMCDKCWDDAHLRAQGDTGKDQYAHYVDLMDERRESPCTPEEQGKTPIKEAISFLSHSATENLATEDLTTEDLVKEAGEENDPDGLSAEDVELPPGLKITEV